MCEAMGSWTVGRMVGGAITGAVLTTAVNLGGVWVIVGMALSGMSSSVESTNNRIGDIVGQVKTIDDRLFNIQAAVANGFKDTRTEIQKASRFDPLQIPPEAIRIANKLEDKARFISMSSAKVTTVLLPSFEAWGKYVVKEGPSAASEFLGANDSLDRIADFYTIEGMTADDIVKKSRSSPNGVLITSAGGVDFTFTTSVDKTIIKDSFGIVAEVEGLGVGTPKLSVMRIDKVFDLNRF